jgi:hypothetical protein
MSGTSSSTAGEALCALWIGSFVTLEACLEVVVKRNISGFGENKTEIVSNPLLIPLLC